MRPGNQFQQSYYEHYAPKISQMASPAMRGGGYIIALEQGPIAPRCPNSEFERSDF